MFHLVRVVHKVDSTLIINLIHTKIPTHGKRQTLDVFNRIYVFSLQASQPDKGYSTHTIMAKALLLSKDKYITAQCVKTNTAYLTFRSFSPYHAYSSRYRHHTPLVRHQKDSRFSQDVTVFLFSAWVQGVQFLVRPKVPQCNPWHFTQTDRSLTF